MSETWGRRPERPRLRVAVRRTAILDLGNADSNLPGAAAT